MQASNEYPSSIRVGHVTEFDCNKLRARVSFSDMGIISHWLPVLITNSLNTKDSCYLDPGEHVVCLMQGTGCESGFVLGAIYDDKCQPVIKDPDTRSVTFDDGTSIKYDRKEHVLTIDCVNEVIIKAAQHISLQAGRIDIN